MNGSGFTLLVQCIGFLGAAAAVISCRCRRHSAIMTWRSANELLFALQYFLLGAYTGMAMNLIGVVRNTIFTVLVKRGRSTMVWRFFFIALYVVFAVLSWAGFPSLLSAIAKTASTFAYGSRDVRVIRITLFCTNICWLLYDGIVGSAAGVLCEVLSIVALITVLVRERREGICRVSPKQS